MPLPYLQCSKFRTIEVMAEAAKLASNHWVYKCYVNAWATV